MLDEAGLDQLGDKLIDEVWSNEEDSPPDLVYHYTDASGLVGFLNSKKLWSTEYRFMNDASEVELGLNHFRFILREMILKEKLDRRRRYLEAVMDEVKVPLRGSSYVFSFSEKRDDLSQWRGYAKDGFGFAIGFETNKLKKILDKKLISFGKICYNSAKQTKRYREVINRIYEFCDASCPTGMTQSEKLIAADETRAVIASVAAGYKHSTFAAENEWRMHFYPRDNQIKIRVSGTKLIPYVEVDISSEDDESPIACIGLGPGFKSKEHAYAVQKLLDNSDVKAEIYFASTPFRSG